jgi:hypothetical protein
MQRSEQDVIENSQRARSPDRRKSTTNTRVSFVGKADASAIDCMVTFNNYLKTTTNTQQSPLIDFDKMELFDVYFPLNNYENVIKRYQRILPDKVRQTLTLLRQKKIVQGHIKLRL